MPAPLRITVVNAAFDPALPDPEALLARYTTLTGWCTALAASGAAVSVLQRFGREASLVHDGVAYQFVRDGEAPRLTSRDTAHTLSAAVRGTAPDLVHVNGMGFPALVASLRAVVGPTVAIVVQDHAGGTPPAGAGMIARWRRARWATGLAAADALSFTAAEQAIPWRDAGVLRGQAVLAFVESSTTVRATPRDAARHRTGLDGDPLVLWVGRLIPGKDPLTALAGFENFAATRPGARLALLFPDGPLADSVRAAVAASPTLRDTVTLVGSVDHARMGDYYGAADLYLSTSHAEGSGYALIEALACGVTPVVSDIPSFRAIAGRCGCYFPVGQAAVCAEALRVAADAAADTARRDVQTWFETTLSWAAIGRQTFDAYDALAARRRASGAV